MYVWIYSLCQNFNTLFISVGVISDVMIEKLPSIGNDALLDLLSCLFGHLLYLFASTCILCYGFDVSPSDIHSYLLALIATANNKLFLSQKQFISYSQNSNIEEMNSTKDLSDFNIEEMHMQEYIDEINVPDKLSSSGQYFSLSLAFKSIEIIPMSFLTVRNSTSQVSALCSRVKKLDLTGCKIR